MSARNTILNVRDHLIQGSEPSVVGPVGALGVFARSLKKTRTVKLLQSNERFHPIQFITKRPKLVEPEGQLELEDLASFHHSVGGCM